MLEKYDVSKEGIGKDRLIYCKMLAFHDTEPVKVITGACVKIGLNQEKPYK